MKPRECPRRWETEMANAGLSSAAELAQLNGHVESCADCAETRRFFETVRMELRAPADSRDALSLRRLRNKTLARASAAFRPARDRRLYAGAFGAFAAACLGVCLFGAVHKERPPLEKAAVVVEAATTSTSFSHVTKGGSERIDLMDGTLSLSSRRMPSGAKLIVYVPDGAIEDVGTVFKVSVSEHRTVRIAVTEGEVVFRRPGAADLRILAGSVWTAPEEARASAIQAAPLVAAAPGTASASPLAPRRERTRSPSPRVVPEADTCPDEDAAYLRIVALLREHRAEEARMGASDYLRRCPSGFRRTEVARISRGP